VPIAIARPREGEFASYYARYTALVPDGDVLQALARQGRDTAELLRRTDEKRSQYRYAEGKWSVREVIGHVADAERVFAYRALTFARADAVALPSFDEQKWAAASNAHARPLAELAAELAAVRAATLALFSGFGADEIARAGVASNNPMSVRSLAWIIAGHELHHVKILRERYGLT
jgi:uncharacterized damage-inducible protein DinB